VLGPVKIKTSAGRFIAKRPDFGFFSDNQPSDFLVAYFQKVTYLTDSMIKIMRKQ
jgi:hypothetical protein